MTIYFSNGRADQENFFAIKEWIYFDHFITQNTKVEIRAWLEENIDGIALVETRPIHGEFAIGFEKEQDAVAFKLRWI